MRQVLQSLRTGETSVVDVPCPAPGQGQLLLRTSVSLLSAGTERMLLDFGRSGWIGKARSQPEKLGQVVEKARVDGIVTTLETVLDRLDRPIAPGYCNVSTVIGIGAGVSGYRIGDRVASNGPHAEAVTVPVNLCARVPGAVADEAAAFTVLGAIALQGIRLADPTLGEAVVVIGLGLVGLLAVQLLRANGCRVLGVDPDASRREIAARFGAETVDARSGDEVLAAAERLSRGRGVDAVLVAAATTSREPVRLAARMCRKRGRIVLVGTAGLELERSAFFEKELSFQVSCSYGPGRYDPAYEEGGNDYPFGHVRWTEGRNLEAVLDLMEAGRLDTALLVSHRFEHREADSAYALLAGPEASLGILLTYPDAEANPAAVLARRSVPAGAAASGKAKIKGGVSIGVVGAGNHALSTLVPAFAKTSARLEAIGSAGGFSAAHAARKFGFSRVMSDAPSVVHDPDIDAVVIATRHDLHAGLAVDALRAGKDVFVEKPLALATRDVDCIEAACSHGRTDGARPLLMVGYNRRFAPHVVRMKALLDAVEGPRAMVVTVNAGAVPTGHWTLDAQAGGGRIAGEACHFVDLLRFLAGTPIVEHRARAMASKTGDTATIDLTFADGSIGSIHYFANGPRSYPKERLEMFAGGRALRLDNFRQLRGYGWPGFRTMNLWRQDKGHLACARAFVEAVAAGGPSPIPLEEILEVARVTIDLAEAVGR